MRNCDKYMTKYNFCAGGYNEERFRTQIGENEELRFLFKQIDKDICVRYQNFFFLLRFSSVFSCAGRL